MRKYLFASITSQRKSHFMKSLKVKTRRPIGHCEVCCQTIRDCTVAHSLVWVSWIFGKKKISWWGFYYRLKCENLLEKLITANFVVYFDFFLFELPRRGRPARDHQSRQSVEILLAYWGKRKLNPKSNFSKIFFISNIWLMRKLWVWIFDLCWETSKRDVTPVFTYSHPNSSIDQYYRVGDNVRLNKHKLKQINHGQRYYHCAYVLTTSEVEVLTLLF